MYFSELLLKVSVMPLYGQHKQTQQRSQLDTTARLCCSHLWLLIKSIRVSVFSEGKTISRQHIKPCAVDQSREVPQSHRH